MAAVTAIGISLATPSTAHADILDDALSAAGQSPGFGQYINAIKTFYSFVKDGLGSGQSPNAGVIAAINAAQSNVIAEIDAVASSQATSCARQTVEDFVDVDKMDTAELHDATHRSSEC